jgi:hypothetical protein
VDPNPGQVAIIFYLKYLNFFMFFDDKGQSSLLYCFSENLGIYSSLVEEPGSALNLPLGSRSGSYSHFRLDPDLDPHEASADLKY